MKLDDAELQETTGFVIAQGFLKIGSQAEATISDGGATGRVLLSSERDAIAVWPVTQVKRDAYGFYETTLGEFGVAFRSLSLNDIGALSCPDRGRQSMTRKGSQVGELRQRVNEHNIWLDKQRNSIQHYELTTEHVPEGLHIEVSGQMAATEGEAGKQFAIDMTIPWPTLSVKAIPGAGNYRKFWHQEVPSSKLDSASLPLDPRKLSDILLSAVFDGEPFIKGRISFVPEPLSSPFRFRLVSPHDFVLIHLDRYGFSFSDAPKLTVLNTGFAGSGGSELSLTLEVLNRRRLECAFHQRYGTFRQRDKISLRLEGDALGSVRYPTGYAEEAGDPLGWIHQPIKTLSLNMTLGKDGLEISADGELDDFEPAEIAFHREKRNSQLKPLRAYSLRATIPWALLVARGFSFAYRARDF